MSDSLARRIARRSTCTALAAVVLATGCTSLRPGGGARAGGREVAYVTNTMHGTVSVVDPGAGKVLADLEMPRAGARLPFPAFAAATPDGAKVYVANLNSLSLGVIDTRRNQLARQIALPDAPHSLAATPDGRKLYVASDGGAAFVVDTASDSLAGTVALGAPSAGAAVAPDGTRAYFTTEEGLSVVDVATNTKVAQIADVINGSAVVVDPAGQTVYALANLHPNGVVYLIDGATHQIARQIVVESSPVAAAVTPDGRWLYVVNRGSNSVSAIDLKEQRVAARLPVGSVPAGLAMAASGEALYVTDSQSNALSVISPEKQSVIGTIALNPPPQARPTGIVVVRLP
jgi:YVTN family beta-propeller protein